MKLWYKVWRGLKNKKVCCFGIRFLNLNLLFKTMLSIALKLPNLEENSCKACWTEAFEINRCYY